MGKNEKINKTKTIILLIILIAMGGIILYGEKDSNFKINKPPTSFNVINN